MTCASDEDKYTLEYFPHGGREGDDEPPFKYRTFYLDDAVAEAWRIARGGGSALRIKRQGESDYDEEGLRRLLDKMSKLEGEHSGRGDRELAALAIGESGEAGAASEEAESEPGDSGSADADSKEAESATDATEPKTGEIESPS